MYSSFVFVDTSYCTYNTRGSQGPRNGLDTNRSRYILNIIQLPDSKDGDLAEAYLTIWNIFQRSDGRAATTTQSEMVPCSGCMLLGNDYCARLAGTSSSDR